MSMFGVDASEMTRNIQLLRRTELSTTETRESFARAAWSGIAEPGDAIAGALVHALGGSLALTVVIERWPVDRVLSALEERGAAMAEKEVTDALARWFPRLHSKAVVGALRQGARLGARLLLPGDHLWPTGVDDLGHHAPIALWVRGTDDALSSVANSISLVGARAATGYGEHVTMEAAAGLVDRGFAIVSGAAYGIDGMAHRSALASNGQTIAFLAGGVDRFYPSGHDSLLTRMVAGGAVITELPPGAQPTKWRFLQRNRLIAAASQATIVLEAGWRSGSLNTAAHAAALGRPLGAVPGPVTSPASAGCHRLIREFDAVCVTTAEEMAELAPGGAGRDCVRSDGGRAGSDGENDDASPDRIRILDALSRRSPRSVEDVAARSGLSLAATQAQLGLLGMEDAVVERERGWVRVS
ncbi:MAG: DNA-protecting protein DprA [Salinibacterium sp.]|nr:DNA-processing protein DprA [Salinibacterium sp.]MBF0671122.1 DNA-protecting protein DprA [Salinibacterium sp.]